MKGNLPEKSFFDSFYIWFNKEKREEYYSTPLYLYSVNRKDDFVKFVKTNKEFSPKEFIKNYLSFIENDFSYKPASTSKKEIKDIELWRSAVDEKQNDEIKNAFLKYINKDKKVLKK